MKTTTIVSLLLAVALVTGCGGGAPAATPVAPAPPVTAPTNTPAAVPPTPVPPPTVSQPVGSDEYEFRQSSDLSNLASYRLSYSFRWESTTADGTQTGSWQMTEAVIRNPPARHLSFVVTDEDDEASGTRMEFIVIGNDTYLNSGDEWIAMGGDQGFMGDDTFLSNPMDAVSTSRGRLVQRGVTVNGVATDHYSFEERSGVGAFGAGAQGRGEVWVSTQHNVVVKYVARYEGAEVDLSDGDQGILDIALDVTDINQPFTIEPPAGVGPAMPADVPVLPGATDVMATMGIVQYKTNLSPDEVKAFYVAQMPAYGWSQGDEMPSAMFFNKTGREAMVSFSEEKGITQVIVYTSDK